MLRCAHPRGVNSGRRLHGQRRAACACGLVTCLSPLSRLERGLAATYRPDRVPTHPFGLDYGLGRRGVNSGRRRSSRRRGGRFRPQAAPPHPAPSSGRCLPDTPRSHAHTFTGRDAASHARGAARTGSCLSPLAREAGGADARGAAAAASTVTCLSPLAPRAAAAAGRSHRGRPERRRGRHLQYGYCRCRGGDG